METMNINQYQSISKEKPTLDTEIKDLLLE